jgi:hypothetical protein
LRLAEANRRTELKKKERTRDEGIRSADRGGGHDRVFGNHGCDRIRARDATRDIVDCCRKGVDRVLVDPSDELRSCELRARPYALEPAEQLSPPPRSGTTGGSGWAAPALAG